MSEHSSGIVYPCCTPFYQRRRGVSYNVGAVESQVGVLLYQSEEEATESWKTTYTHHLKREGMQIASFANQEELAAFLVRHWRSFLAERQMSLIYESAKGERATTSIAGVIRANDPAQFEELASYKSKRNRSGRDPKEFLPMKVKRGFVNAPGFLMSYGGTVWLPEGTRIGVACKECFVETIDDMDRTVKWIEPLSRYESWVGAFYLRRDPTSVGVIYESNGSGGWEFQLRLVEEEIGQWFERPLAEGGGWHLERNESAE